jgi:hypothetical protein
MLGKSSQNKGPQKRVSPPRTRLQEIVKAGIKRYDKMSKASPIQTLEKDLEIGFEVGGAERFWLFLKDYVLQISCEIEKETYDPGDEAKKILRLWSLLIAIFCSEALIQVDPEIMYYF